MAPPIPTTEPEEFTAGDTVKFYRTVPDYSPDDGWELSYALVIDGQLVEWTSSDNGDGRFLVEVAAADTASYTAGVYQWQAYVTSGAERYRVDEGSTTVRQNFAAHSSGLDARSHFRKTLDALEALMEGKATKDQLSYSIGGRSIQRMTMSEVLEAMSYYRRKVKAEERRERIANGKGSGRRIMQRFSRP